jgi:hypothetical protein
LADALDLSKEDPRVVARYGTGDPKIFMDGNGAPRVPQSLLMARRLIEAGARVVTLNYSKWDWHGGKNAEGRADNSIFLREAEDFPVFDPAVSTELGEEAATPQVLMPTADATEVLDTLYPFIRLPEDGFEVGVAGPEGRWYHGVMHEIPPNEQIPWDITREQPAYHIKATVAFLSIDPAGYVDLFLSGGRAPEYLRHDQRGRARAAMPSRAVPPSPPSAKAALCLKLRRRGGAKGPLVTG